MNDIIENIKNILKSNGYKCTFQKISVLKILLERKTHITSKEIYNELKDDNIGQSTIYRTLNLFAQLDIVKEININGVSYYELKIFSKNPCHIHFKCFKCNSIIDINSKNTNLYCIQLKDNIESENNLDIYDMDIMFTGLCSKCKEDFRWQDQQKLEQ